MNSTNTSPQKRNCNDSKFVQNSNSNQTSKPTWSQRKAMEKEEEEYTRMFQLFENRSEIQYLNSHDDDRLAASVYGDAKIGKKKTNAAPSKPQTSGYDFGELLKNETVETLQQSWRKY
jgi:hypothetical protein